MITQVLFWVNAFLQNWLRKTSTTAAPVGGTGGGQTILNTPAPAQPGNSNSNNNNNNNNNNKLGVYRGVPMVPGMGQPSVVTGQGGLRGQGGQGGWGGSYRFHVPVVPSSSSRRRGRYRAGRPFLTAG